MDKVDYENDYYIRHYAGFLLTTTLFVALLFSWQSMKLEESLPKMALYTLALLVIFTMITCGKIIFNMPFNFVSPSFNSSTGKC
jgi:hypothetical protein